MPSGDHVRVSRRSEYRIYKKMSCEYITQSVSYTAECYKLIEIKINTIYNNVKEWYDVIKNIVYIIEKMLNYY